MGGGRVHGAHADENADLSQPRDAGPFQCVLLMDEMEISSSSQGLPLTPCCPRDAGPLVAPPRSASHAGGVGGDGGREGRLDSSGSDAPVDGARR